jgi:hypothetical protein
MMTGATIAAIAAITATAYIPQTAIARVTAPIVVSRLSRIFQVRPIGPPL